MNMYKKIITIISKYIPDRIVVKEGKISEKIKLEKDDVSDDDIRKFRENEKIYIAKLIALCMIIFLICFVYNTLYEFGILGKKVDQITKNSRNSDIELDVTVTDPENKKYNIIENISNKRGFLSSAEKSKAFEELLSRLPKIILGENKNFKNVEYDMNLIDFDSKNNIAIKWSSFPEGKISEKGELNVFNIKRGDRVRLSGKMSISDTEREFTCNIQLYPSISRISVKSSLDREIRRIEQEYRQGSISKLYLPKKIGEFTFNWKVHRENFIILFFMPIVLMLAVYLFKRNKNFSNRSKGIRQEIVTEIPGFVNKMILLLNAGVIANEAINKIAFDYREHSKRKKYFYEKLSLYVENSRESNLVAINLFTDYAGRNGIRELSRILTIIQENVAMGTALSYQLEKESELLLISNKKSIEEKIKIAETKMTFPMALQLLVIVIITIAPNIIWR